jgi:hypothetical protein
MVDVNDETVVEVEESATPPEPDWMKWDRAERVRLTELLRKPFPKEAVKQRKGGGGMTLDYVGGETVIRRLIDSTQNTYDFEIISREIMPYGTTSRGEEQFLVLVHGRLTISPLGHRDGYGVQIVSAKGGEDLFKGAVTDSLKKAATLFGVALELYGPDVEADIATRTARIASKRDVDVRLREQIDLHKLTKTAIKDQAKERYNKELIALTDEDKEDWINHLAATKPMPF